MFIQQPEISYSAKVMYMLAMINNRNILLSVKYITEKHRTNVQHVVLDLLLNFMFYIENGRSLNIAVASCTCKEVTYVKYQIV